MYAYRSHIACFLDEPDWKSIIFYQKSHPLDRAFETVFWDHVDGPRLVRDAQDAMAATSDVRSGVARRALALRDRAWKSFNYFMLILQRASSAPKEVPPESLGIAGCPCPVIYSFHEVSFAEVLSPRAISNHHSLIIVCNKVLLQMASRSDLDPTLSIPEPDVLLEESHTSAIEIYKCIPWLAQMPISIMGTFTFAWLPFFIDRALTACPDEYKDWLLRKRDKCSTKADAEPASIENDWTFKASLPT